MRPRLRLLTSPILAADVRLGEIDMKKRYMLCLLLLHLAALRVLADSCVGASSVPATNQHYKVDGQVDAESKKWNYVLTDVKTGEKRTGTLSRIQLHAHLYFFLSQDSKRFAVLDASAGHHLKDRFMIHDSDAKLIASLGVDDILDKEERANVQQTVSHIHWLKYDPASNSYGMYLPEENAVSLNTLRDRAVVISLTDGKLLKKGEPSARPYGSPAAGSPSGQP